MPKLPAKKPKIALVNWIVNDVGGINSWCKNVVEALNQLGIENQLYYCTSQTRFDCHPDCEVRCERYSRLAAKHLSYRTASLKSTLATLDQYDLIIFIHPSPHPTRATLKATDALAWQAIYRETKARKLVAFHDANWQKTNSWFDQVAEHIDAIVAAQALFIHSVEAYPANVPKKWEYFPLKLPTMALPKKQKESIVATQWLKWKNHRHLVAQIQQVMDPVQFYGNGQEYYTLRGTPEFTQFITDESKPDAVVQATKEEHAVFHGYVPYPTLLQAMAQASVSVDLSTKGYTNMTHWEPMTVRTVSMIEERVLNHPDCQIPEHCCYPFKLDTVADDINKALSSTLKLLRIRDRAKDFIKVTDHVAVVTRTLDWLAKEQVIRNWR